jgi:hypothetical protein
MLIFVGFEDEGISLARYLNALFERRDFSLAACDFVAISRIGEFGRELPARIHKQRLQSKPAELE